MKTLNFLLMTFTALTLAACSYDQNSDPGAKKNAADYAYLTSRYGQVTGVYAGTLTTIDGNTQTIRMTMSAPDAASDRVDNRGAPINMPALRARFSFQSDTSSDAILDKITYSDATIPPKLLMASSKDAINAEAVTAQLTVNGDNLSGPVLKNGRTYGQAALALVSRNTDSPAAGDEDEDNQRLLAIYAPLKGDYEGFILSPASQGEDTPVNLTLEINYKSNPVNPKGKAIPALFGSFARDENDNGNRVNLNVDYSPNSNPPSVTMIAYSSSTGGAFEPINLNGTIVNGVISGNVHGSDIRQLKIRLVKKGKKQ